MYKMEQDDLTKLLGKLYESKKSFAKPTGESASWGIRLFFFIGLTHLFSADRMDNNYAGVQEAHSLLCETSVN